MNNQSTNRTFDGSDVSKVVHRAHGLRSLAMAETLAALFGRRIRK